MPAFQVKDFPADLYDELKACAAAEDRSMAQQNIHIVREFLRAYRQWGGRTGWAVQPIKLVDKTAEQRKRTAEEEREERIARRKRIFAEIDALPKIDIPDNFPSPAEIIRQMREERDDRLVPELSHIR